MDRQSEHRNFWFKAAGLENEIIMENERRILKEWGLDVETLYGKELEKKIKSPRCIAGLKTKQGAILNPAKLARGMKKIVENMGVEIRERSSKDDIKKNHPVSCLLCPQSPLSIDNKYTEAYLALKCWNIPAAIMPMPLMGATAPASLIATSCYRKWYLSKKGMIA